MGRIRIKFFYPEGATPINDMSGLKLNWIRTQDDFNQAEAENIFNATTKHLLKPLKAAENWFNIPMLQQIHYDMFCDVWDWVGKFRSTQTIPGIKSYQIIEALKNLSSDVHYWSTKPCEFTLIEQAARIQHRLVFIHPFTNGNGRFSRLISDRYLKANKCPFPNWPTDLDINGECRKQYIHALKDADKSDYEALINYLIKHGAKELITQKL